MFFLFLVLKLFKKENLTTCLNLDMSSITFFRYPKSSFVKTNSLPQALVLILWYFCSNIFVSKPKSYNNTNIFGLTFLQKLSYSYKILYRNVVDNHNDCVKRIKIFNTGTVLNEEVLLEIMQSIQIHICRNIVKIPTR